MTNAEYTTYTEQFRELCPILLSYGMPYDLFWCGDMSAINYYINAEMLKRDTEQKKINMESFLQGQYIYVALARTIPVMDKKQIRPYLDKPFELQEPSQQLTAEQEIEKETYLFYLDMKNMQIREKYKGAIADAE